MTRPFAALAVFVLAGCATSASEITSDIRIKAPIADVVSRQSTDDLVTCITGGLQSFDREVSIERSGKSVLIVIGVMDTPQYLIDIVDTGGSRRVTFRRRTMLFQTASGPIQELVVRCAG